MAMDNVYEASASNSKPEPGDDNLSARLDQEQEDTPPPPRAVRALSQTQERNLMDYLEARFLDVTRNFKKRADPSSTLRTLPAYLEATHHLLSLILQIPPVDPSAPLRTALLLRLTGDVLSAVPGYGPALEPTALPLLLSWLADLDAAWLAVLRAQAWDPARERAVDALPDLPEGEGARASRPSQTERTRLRSLLIGGTDALEEWVEKVTVGMDVAGELEGAGAEVSLGHAQGRAEIEQAFNELFAGTLAEMGSLTGAMNDPRGMEATC
ncbi:hypothetical protein GSI_04495 [Ganoderma sinense ZZ0214-1]|uniref:Uncharacterized protein n=1 Tax=Ganoderma sinense ZZ0214-1 TaxID=1077348 RepID=A0A2G8SH10_9APHY|nr:hypothetical protein GSI_04495 [Ganoderma sinense ZZ0214-1]